ncbi:MAG TPA: hypothetical protein VL995_07585 [Cellvibrio sp.]|nr:hypothetical protein [Cellvibrio sp.]
MRAAIAKALFLLGLTIPIIGVADTGRSCSAGGPCNYTQQQQGNGTNGNIGHHMPGGWTPGSGGMGGGPSASDLAAMAKAKRYGECKSEVYVFQIDCIRNAHSNHARDSNWCSSAKYIGYGLGVVGGWQFIQGDSGATVLLGASSTAMIALGENCQQDMDSIRDLDLAMCDINFSKDNDYCESIKP